VLGDGELSRALTVRAQKFSKSAAEKIRAAGGTVVELDERGRIRETPAETPAPAPNAPKAPKAKKPEATEAPAGDAKPKKAKKKDDGGGAGGAKG
jgi:hypothetical protein